MRQIRNIFGLTSNDFSPTSNGEAYVLNLQAFVYLVSFILTCLLMCRTFSAFVNIMKIHFFWLIWNL